MWRKVAVRSSCDTKQWTLNEMHTSFTQLLTPNEAENLRHGVLGGLKCCLGMVSVQIKKSLVALYRQVSGMIPLDKRPPSGDNTIV